ncbi:MAG: hypothetical protein MJZ75_02965 [Paludibacteraceae bacterium]|nr:hypothetical protein [Paludibacteraceae bacterium]
MTWRLPVALAVAALAVFPIRTAYRKVRIADWDILDHGAVEQAFLASLWVGLGALVYWYVGILIVGVWICFIRRHLMKPRAWMASFLAVAICAFWYVVIYCLLPAYFQYE